MIRSLTIKTYLHPESIRSIDNNKKACFAALWHSLILQSLAYFFGFLYLMFFPYSNASAFNPSSPVFYTQLFVGYFILSYFAQAALFPVFLIGGLTIVFIQPNQTFGRGLFIFLTYWLTAFAIQCFPMIIAFGLCAILVLRLSYPIH